MKLQRFLKYLIDTEAYRLQELIASTGCHASDLSKIVNGRRSVGTRAIWLILSGLKTEHRSQALMCWLLDLIPAQFEGLVHIVRADSIGGVVKEEEPDPDGKTIEGALRILRTTAETNGNVRQVILNMAEAFATK